jgi:hypothetical protein
LKTGDPEAYQFYADYAAAKVAAPPAAPAAAPLDPALMDVALERKLTQVWAEARTSVPDFEDIARGIEPALSAETTPDVFKAMLMSGKVDDMRQAVGYMLPYFRLHAAQIAPVETAETAAAAADAARKETNADAKRRTAIVSGSKRLAPPAGEQPDVTPGEMTREQRIAEFKRRFDEAETTDISAGLTENGRPLQERRPTR